jgi:hypothetical protein
VFYLSGNESVKFFNRFTVRRVEGGNHNPYIEDEQTTQWPKEKVQMYCRWRFKDSVGLTPTHFCACLKPGLGLATLYVVIFYV